MDRSPDRVGLSKAALAEPDLMEDGPATRRPVRVWLYLRPYSRSILAAAYRRAVL